jgi:TetR/AcrR family transcriptional repressor of nem operon
MAEQGLTVGGFYRHFADKAQLVAEAIDCASAESAAASVASLKGVPPADVGRALVERYLCEQHRAHPEAGCPVAALCTQVFHAGPPVKAAFARAVRRLLEGAAIAIPGEGKRARERRLQAVSAMVGALVLARATDDEALAAELLGAVKRGLSRLPR